MVLYKIENWARSVVRSSPARHGPYRSSQSHVQFAVAGVRARCSARSPSCQLLLWSHRIQRAGGSTELTQPKSRSRHRLFLAAMLLQQPLQLITIGAVGHSRNLQPALHEHKERFRFPRLLLKFRDRLRLCLNPFDIVAAGGRRWDGASCGYGVESEKGSRKLCRVVAHVDMSNSRIHGLGGLQGKKARQVRCGVEAARTQCSPQTGLPRAYSEPRRVRTIPHTHQLRITLSPARS